MVNLHDLYLNTIEAVLNANNLDVAHQPAGDKPAGVLWAMPKGTTKPETIIAYTFDPNGVEFAVTARDTGRQACWRVSFVEGVEPFLRNIVKFLNAGRLAAPKRS